MISFLIGFMILPALVGIVLVVTWAVEYFRYVAALLRAHYASKYDARQLKRNILAELKETPVENNTNTEETPATDEVVEG